MPFGDPQNVPRCPNGGSACYCTGACMNQPSCPGVGTAYPTPITEHDIRRILRDELKKAGVI